MNTRKPLAAFAVGLIAVLAAAAVLAQPAVTPPGPPAGVYHLDPAHASLTFEVSHMGFSHYTARFTHLDATLRFDPAHPEAMSVDASIDPVSLALNTPPAGFHDQLMGPEWFAAARFPQITFRSTRVRLTGPNTAEVTGDLTLHGVTLPVTLTATYNGGYAENSFDPGGARVGFSAHGSLLRSAFGIAAGIPAPGSTIGVGDRVDVAIEAEFSAHPPAR
ncbi:MAG: polyisoprenoid-binding protein [Caulobacteraceae bacterium]|nr:polyisoprenoid-binding protein [Caulobacteraceae bacterium]